jgi:hypothetical protein
VELMVKTSTANTLPVFKRLPDDPISIALANMLKNYVRQKGIVDKTIASPDATEADPDLVLGEIYNYLTAGNNLSDLLTLQNIAPVDNLVEIVLGRKSPPPTVNGKVAAWIILGDYSNFQKTVTPGNFTTAYPSKARFIAAAKVPYDAINEKYAKGNPESPDYNDLEYALFPDLLDKSLASEDYAERIGAMTFMLLKPVQDGVIPKPEAGYIADGFTYVRKGAPGSVSAPSSPSASTPAIPDFKFNLTPSVRLPKKKPIGLYVGAGVGVLALVGVIVWATRKN